MWKHLLIVITFFVIPFSTLAQDSGTPEAVASERAWLRTAHMAADAPVVDIYLNEELAFENIDFYTITNYLPLEPGSYEVAIAPAGEGVENAILGPRRITLTTDHTYIIAAAGLIQNDSLDILAIDETSLIEQTAANNPDMGELDAMARFIFIHALDGIGDLALVFQTGEVVVPQISYGSFYATPVLPGTFPLLVVTSEADNRIVSRTLSPTTFTPQLLYFAAVVGTPRSPQLMYSVTGVQTLADLVTASQSISTLAAALGAAGLVETINVEGPYTVFAPTNAAFEASGIDLAALTEDPEALRNLLLNHVVEGKYDPGNLIQQESLTTLGGSTLSLRVDDEGNIVLNDETAFAQVGVQTINGTLYLIDTVLQPSEE
jgi:uncharacterized surface protein with fasciclin (FAS1) repeats